MVKNKYINTGIYLTLVILILILLTISFNYVFDSYSAISKKNTAYDKFIESNNLDILFLGDSHTEIGLNPEFISNNSFNYGVSGESYLENYYRLKRIIEVDNITPKTLVIEADISMREDPNHFSRYIYFYRKDITLRELIDYEGYDLGNIINYYFGFIGRGTYYGLYITKGFDVSSQGYWGKNGQYVPNGRNVTFTGAVNYNLDHLPLIIDLCKQNNIDIVFLKYPVPRDTLIRNEFSMPIFYNKFYDIVESSEIEFHILDYQQTYSDNISMFVDAGHLNKQGAEILSKQVREDLIKLGYIS